jgi:hypothetical protein
MDTPIIGETAAKDKLPEERAFEAEQQPAINPKDILPEPHQLNLLMG